MALLLVAAAGGHAQDLLLTGGKLVDPRAETVTEGDLLIVGGVLRDAAARPKSFSGETLDVAGKWIVPGLRDFHVHSAVQLAPGGVVEFLGTENAARRMLYAGVAGFLDLFNDEDTILGLRDHQRTSPAADLFADVFAAGPCLTATDGHCTEYRVKTRVIDSPEDARREIGELARKRPDVVKLVYEHLSEVARKKSWRPPRPSIDEETLRAAVSAAASHDLPTVVHVRSWDDVRDAVEAGATAVTHVPSDRPIPVDLAELMAASGTVMIPTLTLLDVAYVAEDGFLDTPMLKAVAGKRVLDAYREYASDEAAPRVVAGMRGGQEARLASVRRMAEAGVRLVAGTDAGNWWTIHGFSLHRELAFLVDAGLSPWQALHSATVAPGELVGRSYGLSPGDEGSVLVLEASPIADIRNTLKIHRVIHHGRPIDRDVLLAAASRLPPSPNRTGERR